MERLAASKWARQTKKDSRSTPGFSARSSMDTREASLQRAFKSAPVNPWVLMAMHVLMGGSPIADLVGIGSGHCYYFATDVQGYELRAPSMLRNFFDTQSPAQQRIANRQNAFGGHQWGGGGQRLGG